MEKESSKLPRRRALLSLAILGGAVVSIAAGVGLADANDKNEKYPAPTRLKTPVRTATAVCPRISTATPTPDRRATRVEATKVAERYVVPGENVILEFDDGSVWYCEKGNPVCTYAGDTLSTYMQWESENPPVIDSEELELVRIVDEDGTTTEIQPDSLGDKKIDLTWTKEEWLE